MFPNIEDHELPTQSGLSSDLFPVGVRDAQTAFITENNAAVIEPSDTCVFVENENPADSRMIDGISGVPFADKEVPFPTEA